MSLNSFKFLIFLIILLMLMFVLQIERQRTGKNILTRLQVLLLLLSSFVFLLMTDWRFFLCLSFVIVLTYFSGKYIKNAGDAKRKKCLIISNCILVLFLGYFKYTNFFLSGFCGIFNKNSVELNIILPVGISFYIFSAISYLLDVYWNRYEAEENFINLALYISFFPKLTAGPIIRGNEFLPQIKNYKGMNLIAFSEGIQIFVFGLFKKIVLADRLNVFVGDVFYAPTAYNAGTVILAVVSYSLQIYFDFSGYSDMVVGISKMLGFEFSANFNLPYLASNVSEFWKRWHISLSSWFQEYIYIPLGGSRKGIYRTYLNLFLVMLISGLWHGAGMTFVVWGILYGVANCVYRFWKTHWGKQKTGSPHCAVKAFSVIGNYIMVTLFWVVFRAETLEKALLVYKQMFTLHSGISQPYTWTFFALLVLVVASVCAIVRSRGEKEVRGFYPILDLSKVYALVIFITCAGLTVILGYFGNSAFIYGSF